MTHIIVGSAAAANLFPDWRAPKDWDVFTDIHGERSAPILWSDGGRTDIYWHPDLSRWFGNATRFATLDELYTIKISHAFWSLHGTWTKHMRDADELKKRGAKFLPDLYAILYPIWEEGHGRKVVDLNQDKAEFFDDAVRRKYDHDSIHYSVAYGDEPMYVRFLKDGESVAIDMAKVWAAPFEDQVRLFREEVFATALERIVIPSEYTASPRRAYAWALERTITSLTKGRSALFMALNYGLFSGHVGNYVQRHLDNAHKLIPV